MEKWTFDDMPLNTVDNFNFVVTVFNYTGNCSMNRETLAGQGLKALYTLLLITRDFMLKLKIICQLFDAFICSI